MNLFEARNNYELLVSLILAFYKEQRAMILSHRKDLANVFNVEFCHVEFGNRLKEKLKFYLTWIDFSEADTANVFHEISPLLKNKNIKKKIIIQHGEICYLSGWQLIKIAGFPYFLRKALYFENFCIGSGRDIDEVWVRNIENLPQPVKKKARHFNLHYYYENLTSDQHKFINDIFFYPKIEKNLSDFDILITQPLSEIGMISENRKLDIYKNILEKSDSILIKPHPAEITDYKKIFNVPVLSPQTPVELFALNQVKFRRALTIYSSGIESINCNEAIRIGTAPFPDLVDKVGLIT